MTYVIWAFAAIGLIFVANNIVTNIVRSVRHRHDERNAIRHRLLRLEHVIRTTRNMLIEHPTLTSNIAVSKAIQLLESEL